MSLFVQKFPDASEEDETEIRNFRHQTLQLYLSILDGRSSWSTLIQVLKILAQSNEDRIFVVYNNGLALIFDAFNMLHMMFHEATACHVTPDIIDLLNIFNNLLKSVRVQRNNSDITQILSRWKDMGEMTSRILTLCNTYTPNDMREVCFSSVKEMLMLWPAEMLAILVPILLRTHQTASEAMGDHGIGLGPFSPRVQNHNLNLTPSKTASRPPRPMIQMSVTPATVEVSHGSNPEFDKGLQRYFHPYHTMVDFMVRIAANEDLLSKSLVELSALVGLDGVPLHFQVIIHLF